MAKKSITDYYFAIGTDRMTEQHEKIDERRMSSKEHGMHISLHEFKREVTRWRRRWLLVEDGIPQTLEETLDFANPELYPGIYVAVKMLLTYPVSTCVAERSFSSMKRLKTSLRSAMSDARLTSLSVIHVHKHKEIDINEVISEFAGKKDRRLALCL